MTDQQKLMIVKHYVSYAMSGNGGLGKHFMFKLIANELKNFDYNPYHEDWDSFLSTLQTTENIKFEQLIDEVAKEFLQKEVE